jgi:riboflavin synthase
MFTGIIQDLGEIKTIERSGELMHIQVESKLNASNFTIGNSIAVDGVCLTVESYSKSVFSATLTAETLKRTHLSELQLGQKVNIEVPLTLQTPLAGHLVLGHVDFLARVEKAGEDFQIKVPHEMLRFFPLKGSICINGVSLTISHIDQVQSVLSAALIPETLKVTNLSKLTIGDMVNIEIDTVARYLDSLMPHSSPNRKS